MRLCLLKRPICATCPNVFIVKALRELQRCLRAYERKRTRKPIKLQLYPHDTRLRRNCHREILATCAILFQSRGLQIAFVKVSPARRGAALQAGREFATRQRDEYETDCFTILQQTVPASRFSVYTCLKSALQLHPLRYICVAKSAPFYKSISLENS